MHEITLVQGLSLAALVFILGIDFWLEALFLFRPIIVCTLTGAILGDIHIGLITGGLTATADVVAGGKSLMHHSHPGDSGGVTGPPL